MNSADPSKDPVSIVAIIIRLIREIRGDYLPQWCLGSMWIVM